MQAQQEPNWFDKLPWMAKKQPRVEAPMLREYLLGQCKNPSYVPQFAGWLPWVAFFVAWGSLSRFLDDGLAFVIALALAIGTPSLLRTLYKPRNKMERAELTFFKASARLRTSAAQGDLRKRLPPAVLQALERAAGARATALARLRAEAPDDDSPEVEVVEASMRAAVLAVVPVVRGEHHSRREWQALCQNTQVVGGIVDAIQAQEARMAGPSVALAERLAALQELDSAEPETQWLTE